MQQGSETFREALIGRQGEARAAVQGQHSLGKVQNNLNGSLVSFLGAAGVFCSGDAEGEFIIVGIGPCRHHPLQDPSQGPSA